MINREFTRRGFLKTGTAGLAGCSVLAASHTAGAQRLGTLKGRRRPYLLLREEDLSAIKERISKQPVKRIYEYYIGRSRDDVSRRVLIALVTGDPSAKEGSGKALMESLRNRIPRGQSVFADTHARHQLPRPGDVSPYEYGIDRDFSGLRYVHGLMREYDFIESFGVLSDAEKDEFKEHMFWICDQLMSPKIQAYNNRYEHRRHNFHAENLTCTGTAALCFPEHPDARKWLDYALTEFDFLLKHGVEDDAWYEGPGYHVHVVGVLLRFAHCLKNAADIDVFDNANLRAMLDWMVRVQTPPDRVYAQKLKEHDAGKMYAYLGDGVSVRPGVADTIWQAHGFAALGAGAAVYKERDPEFAARLMWGWRRHGGPYADRDDFFFIDPWIEPATQKLESEGMLKTGLALLRSEYNTPNEKWFMFNSGWRRMEHWVKHRHRDLNSFSLYAYGVPLTLDSGKGAYRTETNVLWWKAAESHNVVKFADQGQLIEDGGILQYVSKEGADYVVGDASRAAESLALQHHRHVLFVKPDYFVIWDYLRSFTNSAEWLLHSPAKEIKEHQHKLEFITAWGVNLDVHFLLPKDPLNVWYGEGPVDAPHLDSTQKYVKVKNDGTDFLTILHPRKTDQPTLSARLVGSEENVIEVTIGKQTDYIMLFPVEKAYEDPQRNIAMDGRVGVVRTGPRSDRLIVVDGTSLRCGDRSA